MPLAPASPVPRARAARLRRAALVAGLLLVAACDDDPAAPAPRDDAEFAAFDHALSRALEELRLPGAAAAIVDRERGIVHRAGYGAFAADRLFLVASASKPLSVGILVRLADEGRLDLDAPIGRYVGSAWGGAWGGAKAELTVAQLVSNSSGLVGLLDAPAYLPYRCQYAPQGTLAECARAIYVAADADRRVPPDTRFRYGGGQWQLAGGVAEAASGKSWAQLVRETYVEPCGTTSLGYTNQFDGAGAGGYPPSFDGDPAHVVRTDNPNVEGGAHVTVEDYATILLMHLRGGTCGSARVLSEAAVVRMQADRIAAVYGGSTPSPLLAGYGLGWWVDRAAPGVVASPGFYGAIPWLDTRRGYGAFIALEAGGAEREVVWAAVRPVLDSLFDLRAARAARGAP